MRLRGVVWRARCSPLPAPSAASTTRLWGRLDLNFSEASVLAHLGDGGPLTQTELARRSGTGRARMGAWVDSLVAKGVVVRNADPQDRRVWNVALTSAGRELWQETVRVDTSVRRALRAGTTSEDRSRLDALLQAHQQQRGHPPGDADMSSAATRVAIVSGAAQGIGAAIATRLAQDGMAVGVLDLDVAQCADTVRAITDAGGSAVALGADVSDEESVRAAVATLTQECGAPTVVVNNAGITRDNLFPQDAR